jgi:hypothetical protein
MLVNNDVTGSGRLLMEERGHWLIGFWLSCRSAVRLTGLLDLRDLEVAVDVVAVDLEGDVGTLVAEASPGWERDCRYGSNLGGFASFDVDNLVGDWC